MTSGPFFGFLSFGGALGIEALLGYRILEVNMPKAGVCVFDVILLLFGNENFRQWSKNGNCREIKQ